MTPVPQTDRLLLAYLHGELDAPLVERISRQLLADDALAQRLMELAVEEATLMRWSRGEQAAQRIQDAEHTLTAVEALQADVDALKSPPLPPVTWLNWGRFPGSSSLFLVLCGVALIGAWRLAVTVWGKQNLPGGPPIAQVTKVEGAEWRVGHPRLAVGTGVPAGWEFKLVAGHVELEADNGVQFILEGPTQWQMTGAMRSQLHSGQVTAYVPPQAVGYTVQTAAVDVKDKGTRFGVRVDRSGATEVHVFEGEVEAQGKPAPTQSAKAAPTRADFQPLAMTQAVRFEKSGELTDWLRPQYEAFDAPRLAPGILRTSKNVRWLPTAPSSLERGAFTSDQYIYLIQERQNVTLPGPIAATFQAPMNGTRSAYDTNIAMLPGGLKVDSYLLHFNAEESRRSVGGDIEFDRPIVAVIARGNQLGYCDKWFGLPNVAYEQKEPKLRGLKGGSKETPAPDVLNFQSNRNMIGIHCEAGRRTVSEVRILVQARP